MAVRGTGVLDGVRVVDFGQYISGPLVAQWLADFGADVIRVDPPGGPFWRSEANAMLQRGKRSIVLDLKESRSQGIARRLIDSADVVIENFRPGVMERLGLGAEAALARSDRLIYASIPGFASDDARAGVYANEGVVAAAAGLYPALGFDPDGEPVVNTLPLASVAGAMVTANSIIAALIARERTGMGQRVEVSLYDAAYEVTRLYTDRPPDGFRPPRQMGSGSPVPIARSYECADGRWVRVTWLEGHQTEDFARMVGKYDEWNAMGILNLDRQTTLTDPEVGGRLMAEVAAVFRTAPAEYWERTVGRIADLAVIRSTEEWLLFDEQSLALEGSVRLVDPDLGVTFQGGIPVTLTGTPARPSARHELDADRDAIIEELDRLPTPEPATTDAVVGGISSALQGYRAVDLTVLLAGPTACRLLAEYGAEVIHVGNPNWKGMDHFHYAVHTGKRTMLLDLKKPGADEVFHRLVESADVISTNFSQSVATRLGVADSAVREYNPSVVYSRISAHGTIGPRAEYRGHEEIGQAVTGALTRFSGTPEGNMQFFVLNDEGTGHVGAFGILLALYHRLRTGKGQFVGSSLAQTCIAWQVPYMVAHKDRDWNDPGGLDFRGYGPLERVYRGADGRWFFLAVRPSAGAAALSGVTGLEGIDETEPASLQAELAGRFATEPAHSWIERINKTADAGAGLQATMDEIVDDPWSRNHGLVNDMDFPEVGEAMLIGPAPRLSRTPMRIGNPVRPAGADGRAILDDIGLGDKAAELIEQGVVVEARKAGA
ncbi:hypothetical protein CcI49_11320 [Frankia sp. CcI49]|nr:hypothetical protein CcI49_11320 [Frankia sp. CcI49]